MALGPGLCKEDMEKIDACVDLILLEKYRDAAALVEGSGDPLMLKLWELCNALRMAEAYLRSLSRGKIFTTAWPGAYPGGRLLRAFHQNLYTLLYQMKRFAQSDYSRLAGDLGDMSGCYNGMLEHLRRKQAQAELSARRDPLTGLLNRRAFLEQADLRIKEKPGQEGVLLVVALGRLCEVTDEHGMDGCDQYIAGAARDFGQMAGWSDLLGRVADNEFALYTHGQKKAEETLVELKALVLELGGKSAELRGKTLPYHLSCGAARCPADHTAAHRLLERARAMDRPLPS